MTNGRPQSALTDDQKAFASRNFGLGKFTTDRKLRDE